MGDDFSAFYASDTVEEFGKIFFGGIVREVSNVEAWTRDFYVHGGAGGAFLSF